MKSVILAFVFAALLNPCAQACESGFQSFKSTVYKKVRQDCVKCHGGTHPSAPPFAVEDANTSYQHLLTYMNFSKLEESLLVVRAGNGHCGESVCEDEAEMLRLVSQWWQNGENACLRNGKYFTPSVALPDDLPKPNQGFTTMAFDLGTANTSLTGVRFELQVQNYLDPSTGQKGAYRVRAPRFTQGTQPIRVKDIKILLNGKYDPIYNNFTTVSKTVSFLPVSVSNLSSASPVLSGHSMIILKDTLAKPKLQISFAEIESVANPVACPDELRFSSKIESLLRKNKCVDCHHSSADSVGGQVFDASAPTAQLCRVATELTDVAFPLVSPLVSYPSRGFFGHPQLAESDRAEFVSAVRHWIRNED